jgi:hypothetical protein
MCMEILETVCSAAGHKRWNLLPGIRKKKMELKRHLCPPFLSNEPGTRE